MRWSSDGRRADVREWLHGCECAGRVVRGLQTLQVGSVGLWGRLEATLILERVHYHHMSEEIMNTLFFFSFLCLREEL